MELFIRILKWVGGILAALIFILIVFISIRGNRTFEAPYPNITASQDSTLIARGKYLAFGPAHCATCHVPRENFEEVENGLEMPLSGGWDLAIPPGKFYAPNLTPDIETGIGSYTDGELARALRYMVKKDGTLLAPFMAFQELSDEDLTAIISFLRSQPAVKHSVPSRELAFPGKAAVALGLLKPRGPMSPPPARVAIDSSIAYGEYITRSVANCYGCHTKQDMLTGEFIGGDFGGGNTMESDPFIEGLSFTTPNLTPHPTDGYMKNWDEDIFISRFQAGRVHRGSPMPWGANSKMSITELKAVYRYLISVEPVAGKTEKTIHRAG